MIDKEQEKQNDIYLEKLRLDLTDKFMGDTFRKFSESGWFYTPKTKDEKKKLKIYMKKIFTTERFAYNYLTGKGADLNDNIEPSCTLNLNFYIIPETNLMTTIFSFKHDVYFAETGLNINFDTNEAGDIETGLERCLEMQYRAYNDLFIGELVNPFLEHIGRDTIKI